MSETSLFPTMKYLYTSLITFLYYSASVRSIIGYISSVKHFTPGNRTAQMLDMFIYPGQTLICSTLYNIYFMFFNIL